MSGRGVRGFLVLAGVLALGWWIHEKRPTFSGIIDDLTHPFIGSRAVVKESEHKRVIGEASQIVAVGEEKPVGAVYEGMSDDEVRRLMGDPDVIERVEDERGDRVRWIYRGVNREILIKNHRVASITIR
ncbi:MAG TPA: hypothetical protein VGS98_04065 [Thermoanaerobaculia bacterium]|jgi:hypothetical protein|nr:hypothetical protein [Thermoanaerobaculia bacterium]